MTQEALRNLDYLKSSFVNVGFGNLFHEQLEEGIKSGKTPIEFGIADFRINDKEVMSYSPRVIEMIEKPGFYIFPDFTITKSVEGNPDLSMTVPHYKMTGMTVEQARVVMDGGTVVHSEGEDNKKVPKFYITAIDQSKPWKEGENPELIKLNAKNFDFVKLLSKQSYVTNGQSDKDMILTNVQSGIKTQVTLRERIDGRDQFQKAYLQTAILDGPTPGSKDLAVKVLDLNGKEIRPALRQAPKEEKVLATGLTMRSDKKQETMSTGSLRMAAGQGDNEKTGRTLKKSH